DPLLERRRHKGRALHHRHAHPPRLRSGEPRRLGARLAQSRNQGFEHGLVHRPDELDPDYETIEAADQTLDRVEPFELYPHMLVDLRALDELELTAVRRDVVDVDPIGVLAGAPKRNIGVERNPGGPALV